jgi:hypothetical protein
MDATGAPLTPTGISPLIALFPPATRIPPLSPSLPCGVCGPPRIRSVPRESVGLRARPPLSQNRPVDLGTKHLPVFSSSLSHQRISVLQQG